MSLNAIGQQVTGVGSIDTDGLNLLTLCLQGLHLITKDITNTAASFNATGQTETIYNLDASTIAAFTITLPSVTTPGQTLSLIFKSAVTSLTVTIPGSLAIGTAPTAAVAGTVYSFRAVDNIGTFIRVS